MSLTAIDKNQQTGFGAHFVDGELHTRADEQATAPADVGWAFPPIITVIRPVASDM